MTIPNTCGPRDKKLQQTASQICPGCVCGGGRARGIGNMTPKDSKQHRKQQQGTGSGGSQASQTRKHLGQRQSRKESAFRPGCNLGSDMDCGRTCGLKTQTRSPAAVVGTGLPFSLPRVCLQGGGTPKSEENPKQERPCGRLKAKIRPLVSLPTAKPLVGWFYLVARNSSL